MQKIEYIQTTSLRISFHLGHRNGGSARQRQDLHCKEAHKVRPTVLDVWNVRDGVSLSENAILQYPFADHWLLIEFS